MSERFHIDRVLISDTLPSGKTKDIEGSSFLESGLIRRSIDLLEHDTLLRCQRSEEKIENSEDTELYCSIFMNSFISVRAVFRLSKRPMKIVED